MMSVATNIEIEKNKGFWRAKGFTRPADYSERLERDDCHIVYRYKAWRVIEPNTKETRHKSHSLRVLLTSFI